MRGLEPKKLNARRGSILVFSYFLIATMLGLVMPQTMRSLGSVQLERRNVDNAQTFYLAEGAADLGLKLLKDNPDFGNSRKAPTGGYTCASPGSPPAWCYSASLPGAPAGSTYSLRGQDVCESVNGFPGVCAVGKELVSGSWGVRRYLSVTTALANGNQFQHDIVVDVLRRPGSSNPRGSVLGVDQVIIGTGAKLYGDVTSQGGGNKSIYMKSGSTVQGKLKVGRAGGSLQPTQYPVVSSDSKLCCDANDAIRIGPNAKVIDMSNNTIATSSGVSAPGNALAPSWRTDDTGMAMLYANTPVPTTDPSKENPHRSCLPGGAEALADNQVKTYGDPAFPTTAGTQVGNGWTEYCFTSMQLQYNSVARFVGDKVRVVVRSPVNGNDWAFLGAKASATYSVHSASAGDLPSNAHDPSSEASKLKTLEVHVSNYTTSNPPGIRLRSNSKLFGSVYSPQSVVMLGAQTDTDPNSDDDPPLVAGDDELDTDSEVSVSGFVIGKVVRLRSKATMDMIVQTDSASGEGAFDGIRVRAWRFRRIQ